MTLRQKTVLIIGGTLLVLLISLYTLLSLVTQQNILQLETQEAERHARGARASVDDFLADLHVKAGDWAGWDETYNFVAGENPQYIEINLTDQALAQLQLSVMVFVDTEGHVVHGQALDVRTGTGTSFPLSLRELVERGSPLTEHASLDSVNVGLVLLPEGPLLVAARPILTSELQGPARGTLIFGRYLDADILSEFSEVIQLPLTAETINAPSSAPDFQTARQSLTDSNLYFTQPLDEQTFASYTLIDDVFGQPAVVLRVTGPRDVAAQGRQSLQNMILSVLTIAVVLGVLMWWLLDRQVLNRLAQLGQVFQRIQSTGDLSQRAPLDGADEITALSRTANTLIGQLQTSVTTLQQREAERSRQLAAIGDLGRAAVADLSLEPLLARVVEVIRERFGCEGVAVFLIEGEGEAVLAETTRPGWKAKGSRLRAGAAGVAGSALAAGATQIAAPPQETNAAFPLHAGGRTFGVLELHSARPNALAPTDVQALQILADQIAVFIENGRLFSQQKRVLQLEELTLTLTNKIHQSLKPETILESAALELGRALGARRAVVKLWGEDAPPPEETA